MIILRRRCHRFTDERKRGHVNHRLDPVERLAQLFCFEQISFDQARAFDNCIAMALGKIIVDHDFVAVVHQLLGNDTPDVSGAAGYKHLHLLFLESRKAVLNY